MPEARARVARAADRRELGGGRRRGREPDARRAPGPSGFDAARKEYVDLFEAGIVDPTKVVRVALENAVSVASVLLLTEATMTEMPEKEKAAAGRAAGDVRKSGTFTDFRPRPKIGAMPELIGECHLPPGADRGVKIELDGHASPTHGSTAMMHHPSIPQVGAQDPELKNSPIAEEEDEDTDVIRQQVPGEPVCYFNGTSTSTARTW